MSEAYEAMVRELRAVAKLRMEVANVRKAKKSEISWDEIELALQRLEAIADELEG
jgi:hypothetical protein